MTRTQAMSAATAVLALVGLTACSGPPAQDPTSGRSSTSAPATTDGSAGTDASAGTCEDVTATFRDVVSANPDLADPVLQTSCDGEVVTVSGNGIPDYAYIATSPGVPTAQDLAFEIPLAPVPADEPSDVALLGPIAVAVDGVPIYGPTEGSGGDVLSLAGALSACGSHNGPTGFHLHLFGWESGTDCLYSADEVATGSVQVGWSPDGYPIMSGLVCADEACTSTEQLTSSWQLTDASLFATDTWAAHSYVEGSGDLDRCNGRVDDDGQYRYYTTTSFPYVLGCYTGTVADSAIPAAGGGPGR
ncbi:YHYH protein [Agromyces sp. SYSU T0242]|uniref:YHYH protein n=1 Tax=Agromyces litoreus TaxID=3158561 RepID=UPI0033946B0E